MLKMAGIDLKSRDNYVAKFHDPKSAAALNGVTPVILDFFRACGFSIIPSGLRQPAGVFDARFDNHHTDIAKRVDQKMPLLAPLRTAETPPNWNGFDIGDLMVWIGAC